MFPFPEETRLIYICQTLHSPLTAVFSLSLKLSPLNPSPIRNANGIQIFATHTFTSARSFLGLKNGIQNAFGSPAKALYKYILNFLA